MRFQKVGEAIRVDFLDEVTSRLGLQNKNGFSIEVKKIGNKKVIP